LEDQVAKSTTGDGYVGADEISAGTVADGTVEITKGSYSVTTFTSGVPDSGYTPTTSTITLTRNPKTPHSTDVTVEDPGNYGFYASIDVGVNNPGGYGYLEILNGATLTSINEGYYDGGSGYFYGGYNNVRIGFGYNSFGRVTVDGEDSKLLTYGMSPRINVGRFDGTGELIISGGGYVLALQVDVGRNGGTGRVTIDGENSKLLVSD
jgi:T5SS/PEP-CTERM-associated repeat protein